MTTAQTVATTTDTGERETRAAADLKEGDWIAAGEISDEMGDEIDVPIEVVSVLPKNSPLYGSGHLVVFRLSDGDLVTETFNDASLPLATKAEVEEAKQDGRRRRVADQLRQLAALFSDGKVPLPRYSLQVHTSPVKSMDELTAIAERLGVKVEHSYNNRYEVVWPPNHKSYEDGVHMEWSATKPEDAEPSPADPDHGRTTAVAEAKPDTLLQPLGRTAQNGGQR